MINWFIVTPTAAVGFYQGACFHIEKESDGFSARMRMETPYTFEQLNLSVGKADTMEDAKALCDASIVKADVPSLNALDNTPAPTKGICGVRDMTSRAEDPFAQKALVEALQKGLGSTGGIFGDHPDREVR